MLLSDHWFGCPAAALARAASRSARAYLYLFTRVNSTGYAVHGVEFPFLFDTLQESGITTDQAAIDLRSAVQSAWATLATTPANAPLVDAGSRGSFAWPAYDSQNVKIVAFGDQTSIGNQYREGRCATLDTLLPP
jgi:carboxylesterase type B